MNEPGAPNAQLFDLTPVDGNIERRRDPASRLDEVLEERERLKALKWKLRLRWLIPLILSSVGAVWYGLAELKPTDASPTLPSDLKEDVKKALDKSEANSKQIRALGKVTIEGLDYLGRKIDTAHPEVRVVEKPESLKDAEKELEDQETDTKVDKALGLLKGDTDGM